MAVREATATAFFRPLRSKPHFSICGPCLKLQRSIANQAFTASSDATDDLVDVSSLEVPSLPENETHIYDPLKASRSRKRQLPPSRSVLLILNFSSHAQLDYV